jgi:hypothetical protein
MRSSALPEIAGAPLLGFIEAIAHINRQLDDIEKQLRAWHKANAQSNRLETAPGVGIIVATALCALVPDPALFRNGRHFAAWIGLTPRIDGAGGKNRLGCISKAGDCTLRRCSRWPRTGGASVDRCCARRFTTFRPVGRAPFSRTKNIAVASSFEGSGAVVRKKLHRSQG